MMKKIYSVSTGILLACFHAICQTSYVIADDKTGEIRQQLKSYKHPQTQTQLLKEKTIDAISLSPCRDSLSYLVSQYASDPATYEALEKINTGFQNLPPAYNELNPWKGNASSNELLNQMTNFFLDWCVFLPQISGSQDDGLKYIQEFAWFYYKNPAGQAFVQGRDPNSNKPLKTGLKFTQDFSNQRGAYMDSEASTKYVSQWVNDPRIEIDDYIKPNGKDYEYTSWNEFFARQLKIDTVNQTIPSRPVTMPEKDYVVSAPTDCIMNPLVQVVSDQGVVKRSFIENPLAENTILDVKNIPININSLLGTASNELKNSFIGGTGLSCILMPNTYHHFHAPVSGKIVHAEVVKNNTYGYDDWPNWVPLNGNVGQPGTDFSQFEVFQRGVIIIEVSYKGLNGDQLTGYVASIPVGLDTISSVTLDSDISEGAIVKRGYTRLGNFFYGGSLNILLFSQGLSTGAIQTRLGNQITLFNIGTSPE